jgi:DNA-directed RNA polymerase subunit RPC12/RpoP
MTKQLKYLMPHACFECRKAFKQYLTEEQSRPQPVCPECSEKMWELGRTFKAPKQGDAKQWRKVEALVRNGITFHSYGSHGLGRFPKLSNVATPFIEKVRRRSENEGEQLLRKISKRGIKQKAKGAL